MNRFIVGKTNNVYNSRITNNITGKEIPFPVLPENISESISASFTQQDIIGASAPRIVYASTSAKTISLSLKNLTEDYIAEGFNSLQEYVQALQALVYPMYEGSIVRSPDLTLTLGEKSMSCVCTNVSVNWGNSLVENTIKSCSVDLSLLVTRSGVPGATEIESKG